MMTEQIKTLTRTRAVRKGLITQDFKLLNGLGEEEVNVPLLDQYINSIESNLALVEECDMSICEAMHDAVTDVELEPTLESTRAYRFSIFERLAKLKLKKNRNFEGSKFTFFPCSEQQGG